MADSLTKYGSDLLKGINVQRWNLSTDLLLDGDSFNLLSGITEGLGPRYGMAPIPGHMDQEAPGANQFPGLMRFETGNNNHTAATTWNRVQVMAVIPLRMRGVGALGTIGTISTYYAVIISYSTSESTGTFYDVLLLANSGSGYVQHISDISAGLPFTTADCLDQQNTAVAIGLSAEKLPLAASSNTTFAVVTAAQRAAMFVLAKQTDGRSFCSSTAFAVSGADIPQKWLIGGKIAAPDATHAPSLNLMVAPSPTYGAALGGQSSYSPSSSWSPNTRAVSFYCLGSTWNNLTIKYTLSALPSALYNGSYIENPTDTNVEQLAGTKSGVGVGYANVKSALFNDDAGIINSGYQGTLIAAGKAIAVVFQDWYRGCLGEMQQMIDLTSLPMPQVNLAASIGITFGAAGSGILSTATAYEFGVSVYDKRLNYESNVVSFGLYTTGVADQVNAVISSAAETIAAQLLGGAATTPLKFPAVASAGANTTNPQHLNYLEYRFYYRANGSYEWLPALFIDAPKYWFLPDWSATPLAMCSTGGVGGAPGGQSGAFSDYSQLPNDVYTCAVMFQNRAFWLSDKAMYFSLQNNIFSYPKRNSAACPIGAFKGALFHAYYGQAEQSGRLVVFSTKGTFVGKFTGNKFQAPVTVGFDPVTGPVIGNFDLDGSDFVLNPWTSNTAFSYRSAVVGEGILYFWGPQGIFMDNGVQTPVRISRQLEPDIFTYYDPAKTDLIHCLYNDTTKEVFWFFAPKTADGYITHALVYNTVRQKFDRVKFTGQIDAAQTLAVDTALGTSGSRGVLMARQTASTSIQRAYYFDQMNRAGDMIPATELMVKQLSTPVAGVRRLTMASGSASLASVAVNDFICLQQLADYTNGTMTTAIDLIGKVKAVNAGAGTVDFFLPAAATALDAAYSPAHANYFPAYHLAAGGAGLNGITWKMPTKYWMPAGVNMSMMWLHLYLLFQVKLLAADALTSIGLKYRTPVSSVPTSDGFVAETFQLSDNTDGNFQLYRNLQLINRSVEGQAMRWILSGNHIGHAWVLQWLEAHGNDQTFDFLKEFEG